MQEVFYVYRLLNQQGAFPSQFPPKEFYPVIIEPNSPYATATQQQHALRPFQTEDEAITFITQHTNEFGPLVIVKAYERNPTFTFYNP